MHVLLSLLAFLPLLNGHAIILCMHGGYSALFPLHACTFLYVVMRLPHDIHDCLTVTHDCCTCESCLYVFSDIMYSCHYDNRSLSTSSLRPLSSANAHAALLLSDGEAGLVMSLTVCRRWWLSVLLLLRRCMHGSWLPLLLPFQVLLLFQDALAIPSLSITPLSMSWHSCPHDCQHNAIDTGTLSTPVSLMIYDWFLVWRCVLLMSSSGGTAILNALKYPFCFNGYTNMQH